MPNQTERRRIAGRPGALPPPAAIPTTVTPPPEAERTASIEARDGLFYVVSGNLRIRLDDAAVSRLRGAGGPATTPLTRRPGSNVPSELERVVASAAANSERLKRIPGVVGVRAGYKFIDGRITDIPCVVVAVDRKVDIPSVLDDGTPIDITQADPYEISAARRNFTESAPAVARPRLLIDELQDGDDEAGFAEAVPITTYEPPPDGNLDPVTGAMTVV